MSIELKVYDNGDHTCLVWLPAGTASIPGCRGFTVRRICNGKEEFLHGAVGFSDDDKLDPANPWKFPLQRYLWWDYLVKPGDAVQYSIVAVVGPDKDHLALATSPDFQSQLTPVMKIGGQCTPHLSAYFNKGIVAAQWVSRALDQEPQGKKIQDIVKTPGDPLRDALSGLLRPQILSVLADAKQQNGKIFAALYELNDPELIPALVAFGQDCNLILANGAFGPGKPDENAAVRAQLRGKINVIDRMVSTGHFAHNKFVVFCDASGAPQRVLTGSTNWTSSGLCTQANNGLIIDDAEVATDFLAAWKRIAAAGNGYPPALVDGNSTASTLQVDGCKVTPWFVKTSNAQDLEFARALINAAQEGILFLFFNPGTFQQDPQKWTLLQNILTRHNNGDPHYDGNLYIRGVVNQDIPQLTTDPAAPAGNAAPAAVLDPTSPTPVTLFKNGVEPPQSLGHDVLVPHNIKDQFHEWEKELLGASMVNIHSKVIVLDPFGAHPVVMTGSHNLGFKASNANDDNLIIIEGNAPLAAAFAVNIIAIFQNYRWNSYVEAHRKDPKVWHGLVDNDQWQASYLTGDELAEIEFWLGRGSAAAATPSGPAASVSAGPALPQPQPAAAPAGAGAAPPVPPTAAKGASKAPSKATAKAPGKAAANASGKVAGKTARRARQAPQTRSANKAPRQAAVPAKSKPAQRSRGKAVARTPGKAGARSRGKVTGQARGKTVAKPKAASTRRKAAKPAGRRPAGPRSGAGPRRAGAAKKRR